jgi:hypothetical protein
MYDCAYCGESFRKYLTFGQCPCCGKWAPVRCPGCHHTTTADVFIQNRGRCPKCSAYVKVGEQIWTDEPGNVELHLNYVTASLFALLALLFLWVLCSLWW